MLAHLNHPLNLTYTYLLGRYSADQQFLLGICATLSPEMCIFQRDYKPPQARKPEQMGMPFVSNADKFLDGLPTLSAKE